MCLEAADSGLQRPKRVRSEDVPEQASGVRGDELLAGNEECGVGVTPVERDLHAVVRRGGRRIDAFLRDRDACSECPILELHALLRAADGHGRQAFRGGRCGDGERSEHDEQAGEGSHPTRSTP
jgi:hypothetical protein